MVLKYKDQRASVNTGIRCPIEPDPKEGDARVNTYKTVRGKLINLGKRVTYYTMEIIFQAEM